MLHLDRSVQTFRYSKFNLEEDSSNHWQELFDEFSETILESGDVNEALTGVFQNGLNADGDQPVLGLTDMFNAIKENLEILKNLLTSELNSISEKSLEAKLDHLNFSEDALNFLSEALKESISKDHINSTDVSEDSIEKIKSSLDKFESNNNLKDQLDKAIEDRNLNDIDLDLVEEILGIEFRKSIEQIIKMVNGLEEAGFLQKNRDRYKLGVRAVNQIAENAMKEIFKQMKKTHLGAHDTFVKGEWGDLTGQSVSYEDTDSFEINLQKSLFNAVLREGPSVPVKFKKEDFEVDEHEHLTQSATVVMLDQSRSMGMFGTYTSAKKVALALYWLIRTKFPKDKIHVVGFSDYGMVIEGKDLPESTWNHWVAGTNMHHGFTLARQILSKEKVANKQILMITDGEPTVHMENGRALFSYPPSPSTLDETLKEVKRCTREGILINTFMLEMNHFLIEFLTQMTKINKGRTFYSEPDHLGRYVLVDFLKSRARKV